MPVILIYKINSINCNYHCFILYSEKKNEKRKWDNLNMQI